MGRVTPEAVREWVEASCVAQGVPVKVSDGRVVKEVALLLAEGAVRRARRASRGRGRTSSDP